jgi:phage FluMu protein Com
MLPLTRCRHCSSKLLQLERLWLLPDGRHVARRRCPECEVIDDVTAAPEALWAWCSDARRQRDRIEQTMLELAEGVAELEPLEPLT